MHPHPISIPFKINLFGNTTNAALNGTSQDVLFTAQFQDNESTALKITSYFYKNNISQFSFINESYTNNTLRIYNLTSGNTTTGDSITACTTKLPLNLSIITNKHRKEMCTLSRGPTHGIDKITIGEYLSIR